jgi:hypothetical protein
MRDVGRITATVNDKLPKDSPQRVATVLITGDSSSNAFRWASGHGLIVLGIDDFDSGAYADTLLHETAHGLYEHHSVRKGKLEDRVPDALALRISDLFTRLDDTEPVPIPTAKFNPKKPPRLDANDDETSRAAGVVAPRPRAAEAVDRPLREEGQADHRPREGAARAAAARRDTAAADALKGPADPKAALAALKKAGAPLDVTSGQGGPDWLLDPEKLPAPSKILCPKP